ncbi:MAG: TetR/AcrR family transcriptional regulator [Chloroflexota bacterium]|nr:TetR/AcrR family transcriptional regulator [Chloroflexota bacterium]
MAITNDTDRPDITPAQTITSYTPHGDERRQELVLAAYSLIAERGFEGLRTRDIAARAGVNIATLHYYFATKEDLIRGVVDYIEQQFAEQNAYIQSQGATAREQLHAELWHALEIKRDRPELQIVLHELFLRSLRDKAIHNIYRGMDTSWHIALMEIVSTGITEGSLRADLDVDATASTIIAFIKGTSIQLAREPETFPYARVIAEFERWLSVDVNGKD